MAEYLSYWRPSTVVDEVGEPIDHSGSEQFGRLEPGDVLWFVSVLNRRLHLIGRQVVARVVSRSEAKAILGHDNVWPATYVAVAKPDEIMVAKRRDISKIASQLRFEGHVDRLPPNFTGQSLQTMRRLRPKSADLLERVLRERSEG